MKTHNLPAKASEYITERFPEALLCKVTSFRDTRGRLYYDVEITQDDIIHHLKFNEHGAIVQKVEEESFPDVDPFAEGD